MPWNRSAATPLQPARAGNGVPPMGADGLKGHRDVLGPVDEVGLQPLHLAVETNVGDAVEQAVEHHHDLHAGQVGAEAEVGAATAERYVVVGRARDVEGVGIGEHGLVPVGRGMPEHDLVPLLECLPPEFGVGHHGAAEVHHGRDEAQHLLDRTREEAAVLAQLFPLLGMVEEGHHGART